MVVAVVVVVVVVGYIVVVGGVVGVRCDVVVVVVGVVVVVIVVVVCVVGVVVVVAGAVRANASATTLLVAEFVALTKHVADTVVRCISPFVSESVELSAMSESQTTTSMVATVDILAVFGAMAVALPKAIATSVAAVMPTAVYLHSLRIGNFVIFGTAIGTSNCRSIGGNIALACCMVLWDH